MAHFPESERLGTAWIGSALSAVFHYTRAALLGLTGAPTDEPRGRLTESTSDATNEHPAQTYEASSPEVAALLREILENGYIEEATGKRVGIPSFIRAQLASEFRLFLQVAEPEGVSTPQSASKTKPPPRGRDASRIRIRT